MFSLIIALISIALVAILAAASLFYLGPGVREANERVAATQLINETEQIQAAVTLFRTSHQRLPTSLEELTQDGAYLRQMPPGVWHSNLAFIQTTEASVSPEVCLTFNEHRGVPLVPSCADPAYQSMVICCSMPEGQ